MPTVDKTPYLFADEPVTPETPVEPGEPAQQSDQSAEPDQGSPAADVPADDEALLMRLAAEADTEPTDGKEAVPADNGPKAVEISPDMEIILDGQKLTGEELKRGWLRQDDYTRKTQQLAEVKKQLEDSISQFETLRDNYISAAQAWEKELELLHSMQDEEVDWDKLSAEDPMEYTRLRHQVEKRKAKIAADRAKLQTDIKKYQEAQAERAQKQLMEYVEAQKQLLPKLLPEWNDAERASKEAASLTEFLTKLPVSFTQEEVNSIMDARIVYLANQARKWADLQRKLQEHKSAKTDKITVTKTASVKPRQAPQTDDVERYIDGTPWLDFPSLTGRK